MHDALALEPREFYGDGDTVIVTGVFHVVAGGEAAHIDVPFAHVWTVHGGHIDGLRAYNDVHEMVALHATRARPGLRPPWAVRRSPGRCPGVPKRSPPAAVSLP